MPNILHSPKGKRRVNSPAFIRWAMSRRPEQVAKVTKALAKKGLF